jgi:DNA sulfur modification protein DndB
MVIAMKTEWYVPSLRGTLGDWVYYSALLKAEDIYKRIKPSHEIREAKALEDFLQRTLKPRVEKIARYLGKRDSRFFNSIIVGVFDGLPSWAEFDIKKVEQKLNGEGLSEVKESVGLLIFEGREKMFAIDGQHRVEGIKIAYKKNPQRLSGDQFPVIFLAHLDTPAGKVRTRRLFCDINKNAVAVSEGDKVVIDEDDLCAIVARKVYASYGPFKKGGEIAVTERKEILEKEGKDRFTSLLALYTVTKKLKKLFHKSPGTLDFDPLNVSHLESIVRDFFDYILEHEASLKQYFKEKSTSLLIERENNRNLFFRPVGLEILSRLYVHFYARKALSILTRALTQLNFSNPGGIFDGILWADGTIIARAKEKSAAVDLFLYILGELSPEKSQDLLVRLQEIKKDSRYKLPRQVKS